MGEKEDHQQDYRNVMVNAWTRVAGVKQPPEMARWVPLEPNSFNVGTPPPPPCVDHLLVS